MILPLIAVLGGLCFLIWSADRFIDGAATIAKHYGMPPLLVGIVIIGFGTSAPEIVVSAFSAWQGTPNLALGNAYGSNIANIGLIIGIAALISPIAMQSSLMRREFPLLLLVTGIAAWQLQDLVITRTESIVLLVLFVLLMGWTIYQGMKHPEELPIEEEDIPNMTITAAWLWTLVGLIVLMISSRIMVWGAAEIARHFGVDELLIGLTIFAVGTSLPELASAIAAMRKNQPDIVMGNVIGSNLFNTLAVVGIAGTIKPMSVSPEVLSRDIPVMAGMTIALMLMGIKLYQRGGRINRYEGALLLFAFIAYNGYLIYTILPTST
ncbi:calcium/sodium antiporter [Cardiobacteriaceae bacterium TAE3-ERU3]|nr:calcium/sodium antiporter [Cardiobacteriaceae bacterium TAE3-ERU3]